MNKAEIVFCTDDKYIMPTGVLISSIELTNRDLQIHYNVVSENLSAESREKLSGCVRNTASSISFFSVNKDIFDKCPVRAGDHITIATYFRILFPGIFPDEVSKILYLDGDMICLDSLRDLWETDVSDYSAGVVIDIYASDVRRHNRLGLSDSTEYFNAGMMLINLAWWRANNIQDRTLAYIRENSEACIAHDQDGLNHVLEGTLKFVSPGYNLQLDFWQNPENLFVKKNHFSEIIAARQSPCILHFTGAEKPWHKECVYPLRRLWSYFQKKSVWGKEKKHHAYSFKRLLKFKIRSILESLRLLRNQNPYSGIDASEIEAAVLKRIEMN